jgi:ribosome-associated protein
VFLAERRAFYDIERLRKSARPLTPAEFDAELKAALAEKTRSARRHAAEKDEAGAASTRLPATKAEAKPKKATKKAATKTGVAKKAPAKKAAKKKPAAKG